ncbi:DUF5107 domain-containing protein [[Clostridium] hylemonae]|uniref:Tetratricopeptide repeat protein n=1 Tax=[Clostridium] hylemonae DSM 15053 TaxID=553973 RepID=C0C0R8_9FIRM|nr:DUF5107 domain-containing protein [[Clostridium] hylemonae]EEG74405.1 tetratricopeptide repeat protein [[Clostridium] hylemonae DSM 15053]QEK19058.1 hypothetical protein LAJLEIBI_03090 [[Clostridium] hylemonae DSM 15053]
MSFEKVHVWEENVTIPTYKVYPAEKSPLFIENRAYQGSTGKVYPLPVTEKISDEKEDVSYRAVYLENDYLLVMVLPELGGRIQRALDKTNNYDFVYYNHVIKPALVGLTGPWISGGIEFNWPQHHRPTTCSPTDFYWEENADGSSTVYVSEIDKMYGTKGMASFTLHPGKAYIEIKGRLFNRTDTPQTFLWWANPAVPVNDYTYSVFPPDVHAVMDHGKRAVSTFPVATGEYYKYDYSEGIDISCYRNIKVPTSYMAAHSDYDFIGNFDEQVDAGLLHVADHHISPGKKQWTWGNSDFGQAWDRSLTETDGPYIELMTGVYADNQPDFTWLKPYEEKTFTQYFMPYKHVGRVKNATKDAAIGAELGGGRCILRAYASGEYKDAVITVKKGGDILFTDRADLTPAAYYEFSFATELPALSGCTAELRDAGGRLLVSYTEKAPELEPTPEPAEPLLPPEQLKTTEELYLGALHLEQYRHATFRPEDYYLEGLRRDPSDIRLNNGYGLLQYRRGNFAESITYFKKAIEKQTWKNPNPYCGESYFNLGLALVMTGEEDAAFDAFYKSTWSYETQSSGFYWLACLSCRKGLFREALEFADNSLLRGWHNMKARTLKAALLRRLGKDNTSLLAETVKIDPLDMGTRYENGLRLGDLTEWKTTMRGPAHNYLELSLDYMKAGLYEDALRILSSCPDTSPMLSYYEGYIHEQAGSLTEAVRMHRLGEAADPSYCFPNRAEEILILESAVRLLAEAPLAHYYLGCLLYDKREYEKAAAHWEVSAELAPDFAMNWRNLAIYCYNKQKDIEKALSCMKTALELDPSSSRFLLEYDQLCARAAVSAEERLDLLERNLTLVTYRDALYIEYITLLNNTGQYDKALGCLTGHQFHPWEGGEGKVSTQYRFALTGKAVRLLKSGSFDEAIGLLEATKEYPVSLGEGKLPNVQDTIADYYIGRAYKAKNDPKNAEAYFKKASDGLTEPSSVLYYNDQPSDTILYQGFANEELGDMAAAKKCYHQLLAFGEKHLFDDVSYDYFAVSLPEIEVFPEDIKTRNDIYCKYLMALGRLGLGEKEKAALLLGGILDVRPDHQGAVRHLAMTR